MSTLTINGERVVTCSVTLPRYGAWTADVTLAATATLDDAVTLRAGDLSLSGTVVRKASFAGSRSARIVGGRAGWRKVLPARGYSHIAGVKLSSVLSDIARESGEAITVDVDRVLGSHYAREEAKAERVLRLLLDGKWWIAPDGTTRTAPRAKTPISSPFTVIAHSGGRGEFEIATESIASWQPGCTFSAPTVQETQEISSVTITCDNDGKLRLVVLNGEGERLRDLIVSLIQAAIPDVSYSGVWEYKVESGDDSTVDVVPTDRRMPALTRVPMMPGLLGEVVTPDPGSLCRVVFVNSDPTRPECIGIEGTPTLSVIAGGLLGVARMLDTVQAGPFSGTITSGSTRVLVG